MDVNRVTPAASCVCVSSISVLEIIMSREMFVNTGTGSSLIYL